MYDESFLEEIIHKKERMERKIYDTKTDNIYSITGIPGNKGDFVFILEIEENKIDLRSIQEDKIHLLGEMAAGVAHNFNNILASILGRTQLLLSMEKDPKKKKWLKIIEQMALDGASIVKRIQNFTKTNERKTFYKINIVSVIRETIEMVKPYLDAVVDRDGLKVEINEEYEFEEMFVDGVESELKEVFSNIIINAIDAMPREEP